MELFSKVSSFERHRLSYQPPLPRRLINIATLKALAESSQAGYDPELLGAFPHMSKFSKITFDCADIEKKALRVGVVFSGGQAPGGNNVISGLFDALKAISSSSVIIGFLGGPSGLIEKKYKEITAELLSEYRNLGGFDLLGSDRTKLEAPTQPKVLENVLDLNLDGLVIIGGDDSNTNAALLANYFLSQSCKTKVIGVPKTIDGDLKNSDVEISFGFDTATKTYSDIIGNLAKDSLSAKKYYFFVKLMGRTASSIALECALQTRPNSTLIGEEILAEGKSLQDIVNQLADIICERAKISKNYGVFLIPEGLLEFITDAKILIKELGALDSAIPLDKVNEKLSDKAKSCFESLPSLIKKQLMLDRDPHGNLQVSKIETERLLIEMVEEELKKRKKAGSYQGKFSPQPLFCGYEGRSCTPSNFDATYCYSLGYVAAALINNNQTGYMAALKGLSLPVDEWQPLGVPLISMLNFEERKGVRKPVIRKALVDLDGEPFIFFKNQRSNWILNDEYRCPGPIQFYGPSEVTDAITFTLALEHAEKVLQ